MTRWFSTTCGSCRERDLLVKIRQRAYEPVIPDIRDYDGSRWGFARFFYLLRCRLYAPHYPFRKNGGDVWITEENFDRMPKGTTCFVCSRDRWLASQPEKADRETSDDIRILRKIVETKPILRTATVSVRYLQRTNFSAVIPHTYRTGTPLCRLLSPAGGPILRTLCRDLGLYPAWAVAGYL